MRTVTYGGAITLDGFITGPNESMDWLKWSSEVGEIMQTYWKTIDTILFGRKTWEFAQKAGGSGAAPMDGITSYVFSRTLRSIDQPGVTLVSNDAQGFVDKLKRSKGKGICLMGGGDLARSLFEADLIDEVGLNVHPVLLGAGTPGFLDAKRRLDLQLTECRQLSTGCVALRYKVRHQRRARG